MKEMPAPNIRGFIAQLVRAPHQYCEVTGSNLVEVLNFLQASLRNCINCIHNWENHTLFHIRALLTDYTQCGN